tara:strand:- start:649 stop:786 length:138 start_codon:yes stop_codon:yes gene_type:complete
MRHDHDKNTNIEIRYEGVEEQVIDLQSESRAKGRKPEGEGRLPSL